VNNINQRFTKVASHLQLGVDHSPEIFQAILNEVHLLHDKFGILCIQGMNLDYWWYDFRDRRAYFLAPHWFQTNETKAIEVCHWKWRLKDNQPKIKVRGKWGNYAQVIGAYY